MSMLAPMYPQLLMGSCVTPCAPPRAAGALGQISVCPVRTSAEAECVWTSAGLSLGELELLQLLLQ